jgi:AbrB family looped-hinge helix DNA binding protein
MKLMADGQITIPEHIRQQAGLSPGSKLQIRFENGRLWLEKVYAEGESKREKILLAIRDRKSVV